MRGIHDAEMSRVSHSKQLISCDSGTATANWLITVKHTSMRCCRRMRRMHISGCSAGAPHSSGGGRFMEPCSKDGAEHELDCTCCRAG